MKTKKLIVLVLIVAMTIGLTACGGGKAPDDTAGKDSGTGDTGTPDTDKPDTDKPDTEDTDTPDKDTGGTSEPGAEMDAFGKYSEPVVIHLGAGLASTATFPEGQDMENNAYLDILKEEFNIEIVYDWICSSADFNQTMNLAIAGNDLPDMMNVNATMYRSMLKYGQLQDITDAYNNSASDMLKSFVNSGGEALQELITVDGRMMSIPAPELISASINTMWIRQDWLEELKLPVPKTRDEVLATAKAFVDNKMAGDKTIGIIGPSNTGRLANIGGNQFGWDPIFTSFKAYPKTWLKDDSGKLYYGSTSAETKEALGFLADAYADGLIDPEVMVRADSTEPVLAGNAGIFFGPWWSGYTMHDSTMSREIYWQAYLAPLNDDSKFVAQMSAPTSQYVVVNKDFEYPEAAAKIINLLLRDEQKWISTGIQEKLSPAVCYPLYNVYDNADEGEFSYIAMRDFLAGKITKDDIDFSTHKLLSNDLDVLPVLKKEPLDDYHLEFWDIENELAQANMGRMISMMVGVKPLVEDGYDPLYSEYYGQTDTMAAKWSNLETLEKEYFAKIILGQAPLDSFDEFVDRWLKEGGQDILNEITDLIK